LLLEPCNVTIYSFSTLHRWYKNGKVHTVQALLEL
jgi:predicted site-specific integrase-resolvase